MEYSYCLLTDASADLLPAFVEREQVQIIPMAYQLGEEEHICTGVTTPEEAKWYYDGERNGLMTRTSQISPQTYEKFFRPLAAQGRSILYLSLSGGLSSTYNSSQLAANAVMAEFPAVKIFCVDSRTTTGGIQLLLEKAAENREQGMSLEENAAWLEENRLRVCHWFMVDDLMYLKRNGRISPTVAFVGAALNMKPILRIENDGTLTNFTKKRGAKAAMDQLAAFYDRASRKEKKERVFIIHADNEEGADYLEKAVKKLNPSCVISRACLSPVIGCHTGPGLCAIVHFGSRMA